ncbi:aminoglycoside phosphotransferase [Pontibacillus chungwhensis BH030062]|uniref:Aminoglycoside phosphotransferase n=1 Tax=Pontibacillus chungwhensis BH030062 TaxID=1385513 RepID=A0A0A2UYF0_9BACI|nr:aminoglycoside phosphotransferase family protein [Pontibacillus chungwhensis]KGP91788.1 aminoglycoside phosphotransferase [Pontibacillus chungwhensis BH030062]
MNLGEPIAEGNTAKIYISDGHIIKVFKEHLPSTEAQKEAKKQEFALSCGLPVPRIVNVMTIEGKPAIVMEYIKGESIGVRFMDNPNEAECYLKQSVEVQYNVHSIPCNGLESMTEKLADQIKATSMLEAAQKEKLLDLLKESNYTPKLCHGDFHLYNLIQTESGISIIDWVDASSGDPRADVYRTYLLYLQHSKDLAERYLTIYCEMSGFKKGDILQWAPIIAGARLSEHVASEDVSRLLNIVNLYCPV